MKPEVSPTALRAIVERHLAGLRALRGQPVEYAGGRVEAGGTIRLAYPRTSGVLLAFVNECYEQKVIYPFDWPAFTQAAEKLIEPGGIESASVDDLRRLLTTIVRQDRFNGGLLEEMAQNGVLVRMLERIDVLVA